MDESRRIVVPFEKKAQANKLGVLFDITSRQWYIPEDANEETAEALRSLANVSTDSSETDFCNTDTDNNDQNFVDNSSIRNTNKSSIFVRNSNSEVPNWSELLAAEDTLRIALAIRDSGMPPSEEERECLFKILSRRKPGDYPVTYEGMLECSELFAESYSMEYAENLVKSCTFGQKFYADEIRESDLTNEQKAFLMFVLPA